MALSSTFRELGHILSRHVPAPWRVSLLSLTSRRLNKTKLSSLFDHGPYPVSWLRPLAVVVCSRPAVPHIDTLTAALQSEGWPVALVKPSQGQWRGQILETGTLWRGSPFLRGSKDLPIVRGSEIPKLALSPLGVVLAAEPNLNDHVGALATEMGYAAVNLATHLKGQVKSPALLSPLLVAQFPLVSIIVVTHNQKELTEGCLRSVYALTDYPNWELVAVDNGSSDGTRELLESWSKHHQNFRLLKNSSNLGFPAACNQGATAAEGKILCFLNNDTVVTPGWLSALVDELQRNPQVGLVGPTSNGVANRAWVKAPYREGPEMLLWSLARSKRFFRRSAPMRTLALFCAATWRKTWEAVGGLDEDFGLGLFEDDDFSARLREAGYQLRCRLDAYVHHFQGSSFTTLENKDYWHLYEHNRRLFWVKLRERRKAQRKSRIVARIT